MAGFMWCLKELIFPDPNWQRPATFFQHLVALGAILLPYWYPAFSINYNRTEASYPLIAFCISMHTVGVVLMMASDTQKYFVLKAKKGLISNGWFGICRNTNYLGEMMIYASYAALSQGERDNCIERDQHKPWKLSNNAICFPAVCHHIHSNRRDFLVHRHICLDSLVWEKHVQKGSFVREEERRRRVHGEEWLDYPEIILTNI